MAAGLLVLGAVAFAGWRIAPKFITPSSISTPTRIAASNEPGPPGWAGGGPGGAGRPDREAMRADFMKAINATPEQMEKLDALREEMAGQFRQAGGPPPGAWSPGQGNGPPMEMMLKAAEILTPQQMMDAGKFMSSRMNQRLQRARKFLPPSEFAKLEKKAEERRRSAESRMMSGMRQAFAARMAGTASNNTASQPATANQP